MGSAGEPSGDTASLGILTSQQWQLLPGTSVDGRVSADNFSSRAGIRYALVMDMELFGRLLVALGISLVLTLLLLVLYQDDGQQQPAPAAITHASTAANIESGASAATP